MLTQMAGGTSKLAQTSKSLEQVGQKADAALKKLDELGQKVSGYEDRAKGLEQIEKRIAAHARPGQRSAARLRKDHRARRRAAEASPGGQSAGVAGARKPGDDRNAAQGEERVRGSARRSCKASTTEVVKSVENVGTLKGELDAIRSVGAQLTIGFQRIRETSREAKDDSAAATEAVKEIEKKLGPLVQLQELSKNTEERLASLNALAEHVSQKAKALEAQKHAVERAVVEANRLNEMVWAMDVQIAKLNEGSKQVARAEDTVARMEKLAQETTRAAVGGGHRARGVRARVRAPRQGQPRAVRIPQDHGRAAGGRQEGIRSVRSPAARRWPARSPNRKRAWTACWPRTSSCRR